MHKANLQGAPVELSCKQSLHTVLQEKLQNFPPHKTFANFFMHRDTCVLTLVPGNNRNRHLHIKSLLHGATGGQNATGIPLQEYPSDSFKRPGERIVEIYQDFFQKCGSRSRNTGSYGPHHAVRQG